MLTGITSIVLWDKISSSTLIDDSRNKNNPKYHKARRIIAEALRLVRKHDGRAEAVVFRDMMTVAHIMPTS